MVPWSTHQWFRSVEEDGIVPLDTLEKGHVSALCWEELDGIEASKEMQSLRPLGCPRTYFFSAVLLVCNFCPATLQHETQSKQTCALNILALIWIWVEGSADWSPPWKQRVGLDSRCCAHTAYLDSLSHGALHECSTSQGSVECCRWESGTLALCPGLQWWMGRCSTHRPCQWLHPAVPAALGRVSSAGMDPAFSRGSDGMKCANPWRNTGTKICLAAACRGFKGMVRQTQLVKVAPFLLCFPFRIQIICAVWKAMAPVLQTKHSPALQSLQPNCIHPGGQTLWGQERWLWSVCQKCCLHDWLGGSWEAQLPVPSPLCRSKPRHVFTRVRANS